MKLKIVCFVLVCLSILVVEGAPAKSYSQLLQSSIKKRVIDFSADSIKTHARGAHNYSLVVLFTSQTEQLPCPTCPDAEANFKEIAKMFNHSSQGFSSPEFLKNPVFFAICPILKCAEFLVKHFQGVPQLVVFPVSEDSKNTVESFTYLDNFDKGYSTHRISNFISHETKFPLIIPIPPIEAITVVSGFIMCCYAVSILVPLIIRLVQHRMFFFLISLGVYVYVMSGSVFNKIHKPPYDRVDPKTGEKAYFHPDSRHQFVGEGQIMAGLFSATGLLWAVISSQPSKGWKRTVLWMILFPAFIFLYVAIFKIFFTKYHSWIPHYMVQLLKFGDNLKEIGLFLWEAIPQHLNRLYLFAIGQL